MSLAENARVTAVYGRICATAFHTPGFAVLQMLLTALGSGYFYDVVHFTV